MTSIVYAPAYDYVDAQLGALLGQRLASVMAEVAGPLRAALALYLVLYGYAILRGAVSEPIMDFAIRSVKLAFIWAIATTPAYGDYVTEPLFTDLPNALARAVSGQGASNLGAPFDQFLAYGGTLAQQIAAEATPFEPDIYITSAAVLVVAALCSAIAFAILLVAKVSLALLVALGPIFVACALFEASRRFFFGWVAQAINYLVLFALIITVFQLVIGLIEAQWPTIESQPNPHIAGLVFIALTCLAGFLCLYLPMLAAGIAGGAGAGMSTFATARSSAPRPASSRAAQTPQAKS
jgi:type IV secretion system protein VirB6